MTKDLFRHFRDQEDCLIYQGSGEVPALIKVALDGHIEIDNTRKSGNTDSWFCRELTLKICLLLVIQ